MKKKKTTEALRRRAQALTEEIARIKLLKALAGKEKRSVSILRIIEDKIPSTFIR